MTDAYDRLVALRPPVPDEAGWSTSAPGRAAFARVRAAAPRRPWWRRRRFVVPTVMIGIGAAVGGGVAFSSAFRTPVADVGIACVAGARETVDSYVIEARRGASHAVIVAQCNEAFAAAGLPTPVDWADCVFGASAAQAGGAPAAVPSAETVTAANRAAICQAAGFEPVA